MPTSPDRLSPQQARIMLELQSAMNAKIDSDWVHACYPYLRAVVIEAAEAIEHHGWKWWKQQELDLPQLQMEVVDIWHFMMSEWLLRHQANIEQTLTELIDADGSCSNSPTVLLDNREWQLNELSLVEKFELLIAVSAVRRLELALFISIMADCGLHWTSLFQQYVGKNVLNLFRQDHGYKAGTYRKEWQGREDNEHLVEIMTSLPSGTVDYPSRLYQELKSRYLK
jgi:hypothetical protein